MAALRTGCWAVLIFLLSAAGAEAFQPEIQSVYYDLGNPDRSLALIDGRVVQLGDMMGTFRVIRFEPESVVFEDQATFDTVKFPLNGLPDPERDRYARDLFVVKQMRAIYRAQVDHAHRYEDAYADELDDLIDRGFLDGGFIDGVKGGYHFKITSRGRTPEYSLEFEDQETFRAEASPVFPVSGDHYFSVDYLGIVRFSDKRSLLAWAPVWDYDAHLTPDVRDITVKDESFE